MSCNDGTRPVYWRDGIPRNNRRAEWHDYSARCFYMITVSRNDEVKIPFCVISEKGKDAWGKLIPDLRLTEVGKIVFSQLYLMEQHFSEIKLLNNIVMPDHVHAVIYVRTHFAQGLGAAVNFFKGGCTRKLREVDAGFAESGISLFAKGYHDRIVTRKGMLDKLRNYVADNPRKYLIKRRKSDIFYSRHVLECRGRRWKIYGNFLVLREPEIAPLIVSSRYSAEERIEWFQRWETVARNGGVLVSPFFSKEEKEVRNAMIEKGAAIIHIQLEGFPERFAPQGHYFDLCEQGRLLIIGEEIHSYGKVQLTRGAAMKLNEFARWISNAGSEDWRIIKA